MPPVRPALTRSAALVVGLLLATCLCVSAQAATPKPKLVQKRCARALTGSELTVDFRGKNKAGDLILAYLVWDGGADASLSDTSANAYASAIGPTSADGDDTRAQIFYASNVAAGRNSVTATLDAPVSTRAVLCVHEYAGIDAGDPIDAAIESSGNASAIATAAIDVSSVNGLVFIGAQSNGKSIRRLKPGARGRVSKYGVKTADVLMKLPGAYAATAITNGDAWVAQLVALRPAPLAATSAKYPLKVSGNGRYLVDQEGTPFLMVGDSPQAAFVNLSESEAEMYFANREAAGINTLWVNLLCATYTGGRSDASTYDGIVPFKTPGDLSTPNEKYFARVDRMVRSAAAHGIVVLLDPAETGSFLSVLTSNGATKARAYGRYLGNRYKGFDNIVWMSGNDFQNWRDAASTEVVQAVARGIRDEDARHLHTVELDYLVSGSLDDATWEPLIELSASYTYYPTYAQVLKDYNRSNFLPTFMVEANYEFEHNASDLGTPQILRRQAYWTQLSGATGQLYGNYYTWQFVGGWQSHLDTPGSVQFGLMKALFAPRRWYDLVPDQAHEVVTAGYGTFASNGALGDNDYVTAARTPDGALALAYMPTSRTITVDLSQLEAPARAAWYDPSNGQFTEIAGSPLANSGSRDFAPPGANSDGDGDWVLVLETAPPD